MRPIERARARFSDGPSSTVARLTHSRSTSTRASACWAFASAERRSFSRSLATSLRVPLRIASASPTCWPRIWFTTRRVFCAEVFRNRTFAFTTVSSLPGASARRRRGRSGGLLAGLAAVPAERPGRGELAEAVAHHVLRDIDGDELLPVVHGDRVADHLGDDRRAARPGLEDLAVVPPVHLLDLLREVLVDEGTLAQRSRHPVLPCLLRAPTHDEAVRATVLPGLLALARRSPGADRMPAAGGLPLASAHGVVHRVHRHAAVVRPAAEVAGTPRLAERHVLVLEVADLPDCRAAVHVDPPELARRQPQLRVVAFLREELGRGPGGAGHLRPAAPPQLDRVDHDPGRDVPQRQGVADEDVGVGAAQDL